jgi:FixJ family two-component response regulator
MLSMRRIAYTTDMGSVTVLSRSSAPSRPLAELESGAVVFIVDDDASMRDALASLLGSVALQVQCFASPTEFLDTRLGESPSCLILDVRMPGLSGLELQRMLARAERQIPIVFISAHGDIPMAVRAMKAGAVEFLPKPFRDEDLLDAIRQALDRDAAARADRTEIGRIRGRHARLTARQRQVLHLVMEGRLNKQIAAELGLSENTVKIHRRRIMETMSANSVAKLVHMMGRLR